MADEAWTIHVDGASRGNPGPAAFAFVLERPGLPPLEESEALGRVTNNIAEYTAMIRALERAADLGGQRLVVFSDSELMVKQLNGEYRVKSPDLRGLYARALDLIDEFESVSIRHVRREHNSRADALCNETLDGQGKKSTPREKPASTAPLLGSTGAVNSALEYLKDAAMIWARGDPDDPPPEVVLTRLRQMLMGE